MLEFFHEESSETQAMRQKVRAFGEKYLRPYTLEDDEKSRFRREIFNEAGKQGFLSIIADKKYGGQGGSHLAYYAMLEEISRCALAYGISIGVTHLLQGVIANFGTEEQKSTFLPKLLTGEWMGAFSLSEPGAGSDAASLRCAAKKVEGGWSITGTKCWCSNAGDAQMYVVMARTGEDKNKGISAFLVPHDAKGFRVGKQEKKLGLRASSLCELIFENCFVPDDRLVGKEGQGLEIALSQLDAGRVVIGVVGVGAATEAIEKFFALKKKFNEPVSQASAGQMASLYARLQAMKALIDQAGKRRDKKQDITSIAAAIKLLGSDLAMETSSHVVEHLGEYGYLKENEVERIMRDSKSLQIVEGTNQIQLHVLAREMKAMFL